VGNEFEAAAAKIAFAETIMTGGRLDDGADWLLIVLVLEQAFANPKFRKVFADPIPTIEAYLRTRTQNHIGYGTWNDDLVETYTADRDALVADLKRKFPKKFRMHGRFGDMYHEL
jgi:hypothetical protein